MTGLPWLSVLVFLPVAGALLLALLPAQRPLLVKQAAAVITLLDLLLAGMLWTAFDASSTAIQFVHQAPWVPPLKITYYLGVDGLSLPLVLLTALLGFLAVLVSWNINHRVKLYFALLLVLQTGVLGVFTALDFVLFFLFWEVELLPMYLLIAIWGSPPPLGRREYSAMKFLIYTILGSAFMLVGLLALYFSTGTFNLVDMARADLRNTAVPATLIFWLIFFAFAVKLPVFPFHTWLPDAHTDAPTAVSVILAGVLLKMGGYGMLRICVSLFPQVAYTWAPTLALLAVVNVLYGALVTLRQGDLKRLIAYSSVSHMGYVLLGIAALGEVGLTGAVLQMVTHGTITGLLFALVGLVYDKTHTRQIPELGGLAHRMPFIATVFMIAGLASLGLPTMSGFASEFLVFVGTFPVFGWYTLLGASGIVLTAGYILWMLERSFFRGPLARFDHVGDATLLERVPLVVLVATIMIVGLWPRAVTDVIRAGLQPILSRLG
ncbi:MAG: NADH-quinone oxidoreductase subunit M [Chloroflexi bacterium]|nr:NADH-quinone oxidoreductase subunit M [Chloroflexota bacterium]